MPTAIEQGSDIGVSGNGTPVAATTTQTDSGQLSTTDSDILAVHTDSFPGAVRRIIGSRQSANAVKQYELKCLVTGSVVAMPRDQFAVDAIPLLYDLLLAGRGRGVESLFLTAMTAAQLANPELYSRYLKRLSALSINNEGDAPEMFCDLSMPGKALFSKISRKTLGDVFRGVATEPAIDVGAYTRGASVPKAATHESDYDPNDPGWELNGGGGYDSCVEAWTIMGMIIGAGISAEGGPAAVGGALAGGAAGAKIGEAMCGWAYSGKKSHGHQEETSDSTDSTVQTPAVGLSGSWIVPIILPPQDWPRQLRNGYPRPPNLIALPVKSQPLPMPRPTPPQPQPESAKVSSFDLASRCIAANPNLLVEYLGPDRILLHGLDR